LQQSNSGKPLCVSQREYIACVLCLLSALEGILLSNFGWSIQSGRQKPTIPELIRAVRLAKSPSNSAELIIDHDLFRTTLADFLEKWIYRNTDFAGFSLSVLNRHYVLHGIDAGNFYRPADVHRMIL